MNKLLYKVTVIVLKILPILLAFITLLNSILSYFNIDLVILSYIGGVSLITILFIYVASYTFKFCEYHRMFFTLCSSYLDNKYYWLLYWNTYKWFRVFMFTDDNSRYFIIYHTTIIL